MIAYTNTEHTDVHVATSDHLRRMIPTRKKRIDMNTWVLITLIAVRFGVEPTQAQEYLSYEQCMVARSARIAEKIPHWRYECVPLLTDKVTKKT